jgi:hypothetical protein
MFIGHLCSLFFLAALAKKHWQKALAGFGGLIAGF